MRNYWQLQRWFQSQEVQKHQFFQNQRVYFIHNSEDFSQLETRYRSSVDGLQKECDGGNALLLYRSSAFPFFKRRPPRCFWTLFAFSDPHSFVHRPDTVSLRTSGWKMCFGILVNGLFLKRQSLLWVEHNKHTPGWRSISRLLRQRRLFFFRYKSFDFLAVSQVSSKLSRLSYGPVSVFFSFFFHLTESTANHCFAPKWLITAAFIWERGNSSWWSIFCCGAVIWCRSNIVTCCSST